MRRSRWFWLAALLVAAMFALAGCGGEDDDGEGRGDQAPGPLGGDDVGRGPRAAAGLAVARAAGAAAGPRGPAALRGGGVGLAVLGHGLSSMRGAATCAAPVRTGRTAFRDPHCRSAPWTSRATAAAGRGGPIGRLPAVSTLSG
jgi:hypothetical protein